MESLSPPRQGPADHGRAERYPDRRRQPRRLQGPRQKASRHPARHRLHRLAEPHGSRGVSEYLLESVEERVSGGGGGGFCFCARGPPRTFTTNFSIPRGVGNKI